MRDVAGHLQELLELGVEQKLFTAAAAGVSSAAGRVVVAAGTYAEDDPTPIRSRTVFDLASVTKTFTAAAAVRLAEQGRVDLDQPVRELVEVGTGDGAREITLRMLLTHVSGLPAESMTWRERATPAEDRLGRVLASPLQSRPGVRHNYSCVGYIAVGAVLEAATGATLPSLISELVVEPLGLESLSFGPVPPETAAATEAQPWAGQGMLRGEVHDELSRYLGGRVGNAGLFADAADVLAFAESFLDDRLFAGDTRRMLTTDQLTPAQRAPYGQAVGPRVRDREFLGDVDGLGHPGFTGTMWFVAPRQGVAAALLTNRVHPNRDRTDLTGFRQRFSAWAAATARTDR